MSTPFRKSSTAIWDAELLQLREHRGNCRWQCLRVERRWLEVECHGFQAVGCAA